MGSSVLVAFMALSLTFFGFADSVKVTTEDHNKVVGCYWGAWSFYRPGYGKFDVDNFDASLCTHGYYGFADLSNVTWEVVPYDPWYDLAPEDCEDFGPMGGAAYCNYDSYRRFVALKDKNPNFIPILSIGGWNAGSGKFSEMARDPEKRQKFLDSILPLVTKYGFEGVDFDWEYPGSREGARPEEDKENFSVLVKMIADLMHSNNLLLTAALSPGKKTIDVAYDVPEISKHFDIMNVMCYDYHGWWDDHNFTGHNAPLYGRDEERFEGHPGWYFNVFDTMQYYMQLGAPKEKLAMGMATYGRGFKLVEWEGASDAAKGLYCPANAGIPAGPYTRQDGIWGYMEIQQAFNNNTLINLPDGKPHGWTVEIDDCYRSPYAHNGPYWIGYDDEDSIALKAQFINFLGIAGGFIWSIDTDDFVGLFNNKKYPLLQTINREFHNEIGFDLENAQCSGSAPMCVAETPTTTVAPPPMTECTEVNQVLPMPGDCHKYYICLDNGTQGFVMQEFHCGDFVFDPNTSSCIDEHLPGNELICGPQGN